MGAYEAGLIWGLIEILRQADKTAGWAMGGEPRPLQISSIAGTSAGGINTFVHSRAVPPVDDQPVIRMNRDTMYSFGVFDLTTPLTITKPDTGKRFQSMQVVNEDQYTPMVVYKPGKYTLTQDKINLLLVDKARQGKTRQSKAKQRKAKQGSASASASASL